MYFILKKMGIFKYSCYPRGSFNHASDIFKKKDSKIIKFKKDQKQFLNSICLGMQLF